MLEYDPINGQSDESPQTSEYVNRNSHHHSQPKKKLTNSNQLTLETFLGKWKLH